MVLEEKVTNTYLINLKIKNYDYERKTFFSNENDSSL